jgi:hypothetical protein
VSCSLKRGDPFRRDPEAPDEYDAAPIQIGWVMWQASRRHALAQAVRVAGPEDSYQDEWFTAKADAVNRIKALPGADLS